MGFRVRVQISFSLLIFVYLVNLSSSRPIQKKTLLPSEFVQKSKLLEDKGIYGSKIEGGGAHGGAHGGQSHGNGNGNGNSATPRTQGGGGAAAVIPVYAAGANGNRQRQNHHGAANCNLNKIKFSSRLMMILVYPLILLFLLT